MSEKSSLLSKDTCLSMQSVVECVRMEGPWMTEPACVTVQVVLVEITVKVSVVNKNRNECMAYYMLGICMHSMLIIH